MTKTVDTWETLDFRPDNSGWRAIYLAQEPGTAFTTPIAGWLIQYLDVYDSERFRSVPDQPPPAERERRVTAADIGWEETDPTPVCDSQNFWALLPPGEDMPDRERIMQAQQSHREQQERQRARLAAKR